MSNETINRAHQPFDVRPHPLGAVIMSDKSEHAASVGLVYDKGPGSYDHEEMAQVWAWAYPVMFPALASIRNAARSFLATKQHLLTPKGVEAMEIIARTAGDALPVPTAGDAAGTSPQLPEPPVPAPQKQSDDPYRGVVERVLLELTEAMHNAPTMAAGYEILADFTEHAGMGTPIALQEAQAGGMISDPAVNGWRPIETAPKHRTRIMLGGCAGGPSIRVGAWGLGRYNRKHNDFEEDWADGADYGFAPTHWMPLPDPPAGEDGR